MPSTKQDYLFSKLISEDHIDTIKVSSTALDAAIEFIANEFEPEDIFTDKQLQDWAESHGYTKE